MTRKAKIIRKTKETDINLEIDLDKTEGSKIDTTIPFLTICWNFSHVMDLLSLLLKVKVIRTLMTITWLRIWEFASEKLLRRLWVRRQALIVMVHPVCLWMNVCVGWIWIFPDDPI